ncbi:MAG: hypothetical protein KAX44_00730 [Candidatus Brocadiae bacterium]|nr:hypothetical protein [Candidatus Brocadiia bacterium]
MGLNPQQKYRIIARNIEMVLAEHGFLLLPEESASLMRTVSYAVLGDLFTLSVVAMANALTWFADVEEAQQKISNQALATVLELALEQEKLVRARKPAEPEHDARVYRAVEQVIEGYRSGKPSLTWPELAVNTSRAAAGAFREAEATGLTHNGALLLTGYVVAAMTAMPSLSAEQWKQDVLRRGDEPAHFGAGLEEALAQLKQAGVAPWA